MDNRKKTKIYEYLFIAAVSVITVLLFVFTALMPYGNEIILMLANGLTLSSALVIILYRDRKKLLWRIFLIVYIVSAVFLAVYIPFEKYGFIEHLKNPDELRRIILSTGNFGIVVFFSHQFGVGNNIACTRVAAGSGGRAGLRPVEDVFYKRFGDVCWVARMLLSRAQAGQKIAVLAVRPQKSGQIRRLVGQKRQGAVCHDDVFALFSR